MLDYKFIKDNLEAVKKNIADRNMNADADIVVELYDKRTKLVTDRQSLQEKRNANAQAMKQKLDSDARQKLIDEGRKIKDDLAAAEKELAEIETKLEEAARKIPNMASPNAPVGKLDTENLEVKKVGTPRTFDFKPKDHVELMEALDLIDFERGTKVSGSKFYYLKKEEILKGIGFNPRGNESNVYSIEEEGTCLVATAEITLGGYHSNEILDKSKLPLFYCGLSHCFRREAGAAGQFSKGLYRVHQFDKVEMFVYCLPEQSEQIHEKLRLIEEEIFTGLGIPFHVVDTCTGDLGAPAYRKWDLEAWMPGRNGGEYGEVTSTSNCTDYQSRRLNVRYKDDDGKNKYVHMLNGTAIAVGRAMLAIIENYQNEDGSITIPEVLVPLCGFDKITKK